MRSFRRICCVVGLVVLVGLETLSAQPGHCGQCRRRVAPSNQASATTQAGGGGTSVGNTLFVLAGATPTNIGSLAFTAGTGAASDTVPADNGTTFDGTPNNPLVYRITGVSGTFNGGATQFNLFVDAKTAVGNGVH